MVEILYTFLIPVFLAYLSYHYAMLAVAKMTLEAKSLESLITSTLSWVYAMILVVIGSWLFTDYSNWLLLFAIGHVTTLSMIDYEETFNRIV